MSLTEQINADFLVAFKGKQDTVVSVLRMLKTALTNKEIEKKLPKGEGLPDDEVLVVIKSEIKKRKDSVEAYSAANRNDLADKEKAEVDILSKYLPEQISEDQIIMAVQEVIAQLDVTDFGKIMGATMAKLKGQGDGQIVSKIVKEELAKKIK